jgi:hypothetical protein
MEFNLDPIPQFRLDPIPEFQQLNGIDSGPELIPPNSGIPS